MSKILCLRCGRRYIHGSTSDITCHCPDTEAAYLRRESIFSTQKAVTREEYEMLLRRVEALEAKARV